MKEYAMNNLIDIQTQIQKLQKQANELRAREFDKTVLEIRAKMEAFGIALKDLQQAKRRGKSKPTKTSGVVNRAGSGAKKKGVSTVAAKYRGPNGEVWSGRGLMPRWLAALVALGQTKEEFVIKS